MKSIQTVARLIFLAAFLPSVSFSVPNSAETDATAVKEVADFCILTETDKIGSLYIDNILAKTETTGSVYTKTKDNKILMDQDFNLLITYPPFQICQQDPHCLAAVKLIPEEKAIKSIKLFNFGDDGLARIYYFKIKRVQKPVKVYQLGLSTKSTRC